VKRLCALLALSLAAACGRAPAPAAEATPDTAAQGFEPPVEVSPESPVRYPPKLYEQNVQGTVVLRLYADSTGRIVPESTRIAEPSGTAGLDSAAMAGAAAMRFAPARRDGHPVAAAFLQPVHFSRSDKGTPGGTN